MIVYSKEKDGTLNVCVAGYLTRDAYVSDKVVLFSVCYGKHKFLDVKVWKSDTEISGIAACLEKHDRVFVSGTHESYTNKDGETKDQIVVDFLMPISIPAAETTEPDAQDQGNAGTWEELNDDDGTLPF